MCSNVNWAIVYNTRNNWLAYFYINVFIKTSKPFKIHLKHPHSVFSVRQIETIFKFFLYITYNRFFKVPYNVSVFHSVKSCWLILEPIFRSHDATTGDVILTGKEKCAPVRTSWCFMPIVGYRSSVPYALPVKLNISSAVQVNSSLG